MSSPAETAANGATRYTYNTAGYLTKVENFATEWQTQSEMTYDGLGNRLEMTTYTDGAGNTTRYQLDSGQTLSAIGTESSTFYLYGLGAIGTLNESWSYILSDGAGSTRQLVDEEGAVTLSVSYTPWGDTMEIYGSGMLNLGYLGGVYDAGTGLIYMGNGQYYDPSTGRFLTRGAQQDQSNPYTPWNSDPAGMLIAPLALLALVFGRKKIRTKFDNFTIMLILVITSSASFYVIGESYIPSVMADYDRPPIGTPRNPSEFEGYTALPSYTQASGYQPVLTIIPNYCDSVKISPEMENYYAKWDMFWSLFDFDRVPERKELLIKQSIIAIANAFQRAVGGDDSTQIFAKVYDLSPVKKMKVFVDDCPGCGDVPSDRSKEAMAICLSTHLINFNDDSLYYNYILSDLSDPTSYLRTHEQAYQLNINSIVHEFGHAFGQLFYYKKRVVNEGKVTYPTDPIKDSPYDKQVVVGESDYLWNNNGFVYSGYYWLWRMHAIGAEGSTNSREATNEAFADMFLSWVFNGEGFTHDEYGENRRDFMNENMPIWIRNRIETNTFNRYGIDTDAFDQKYYYYPY
ncbi:MAG: hypothetical protein JEZ00_19550 [Anaerolineaceae bacterium]|nr:hypothetical protein [Anaerolineaceae bacterium]